MQGNQEIKMPKFMFMDHFERILNNKYLYPFLLLLNEFLKESIAIKTTVMCF